MIRCIFIVFVTIITRLARTIAFSPPSPKRKVQHTTTIERLTPKRNYDRSTCALELSFDELKDEIDPLLSSLNDEYDLNLKEQLVELPVMFTHERDDQTFDMERWNTHRSSTRYVRLLFGLFSSVTTRRILPTVMILGAWSAAIDFYNSVEQLYGLPEIELPLTPFELTAPILGLLLVFRSDRSFDRFSLGSEYSWEITALFKSLVRELLAFTAADGGRFSEEERAAAYDLAEACLVLHGWIMNDHLRGRQIGSATREKYLRLAIGGSEGGGDYRGLCSDVTTPSAAIAAISLGVTRRLPSLDFQQSTFLESQLGDVISSLGKCEAMLRTPIPLGYTRYSVRFLWIWLVLLPFALVNKFEEFGVGTWWEDKPQPVLVFAMLFIGFIFSSIEDIAVQIEEPFGVLPLKLHQRWLVKDAEQMKAMNDFVDGVVREEREIEVREEQQVEPQGEEGTVNGGNRTTKSLRKRLGI
eukprot:CAMPEP_0201631984 /NCGR_PEP_ID=MMETSP0493-20130528/5768_1 /ASSEMBLY_ACC=CAM_ASM_000838 /TAXON_ID=420259 /ORGANISM="Thalassiosira gravida, Strain GMp14c1" /LENGTH=469 /DNA_ID=CAMNT_0048103415 /DNA_START=299 /DNA_END=1708 /DNA_ORIENTATION=-